MLLLLLLAFMHIHFEPRYLCLSALRSRKSFVSSVATLRSYVGLLSTTRSRMNSNSINSMIDSTDSKQFEVALCSSAFVNDSACTELIRRRPNMIIRQIEDRNEKQLNESAFIMVNILRTSKNHN